MSGLIWALFGVSLVFTVVVVLLRRPRAEQGELLRLRESPAVGVIGLVLWGFCLWVGLTLDRREGVGTELTLFLLVGLVLSCVSLLWYLVRCVIITETGILAVSMLGGRTLLRWNEIVRLKVERGQLQLLDLAGRQCTVGGSKQKLAQFVDPARPRLRPGVGEAALGTLDRLLGR